MSHNAFKISEPIEPQEASPMKPEMNVLGIDIAKHVFGCVPPFTQSSDTIVSIYH